MRNRYSKILEDSNISCTTDGVLRDFISRNLYASTVKAINASIARRYAEIDVLEQVRDEIIKTTCGCSFSEDGNFCVKCATLPSCFGEEKENSNEQ